MDELKRYRNATERLLREVDRKASRKLRARRSRRHNLWMGLRLCGLVGWSIVLPVLLGVAAGVWLDRRWPGRVSWTITLLFVGLILGCASAWHWVERERLKIQVPEEREAEHDE
jgi:ATP synthase protein I